MDAARSRNSVGLRLLVGALAIVLAVAFATSRWRTSTASTAPSIDPMPVESASNDVVPTPIESLSDAETRVSVRPVAAAQTSTPPAATPRKIRLVGEVRDLSGERILAMPAVLCVRTPTQSLTYSIVRGEFVVDGLAVGPMLELECKVMGYKPKLHRFRLTRIDGEQRRDDFVLEPLWMVDVELRDSTGQDVMRSTKVSLRELRLADAFELRVSQDPQPAIWDDDTAEARRARRLVWVQPTGPLKSGVFKRIAPLCDPPAYLSVAVAGRVLASNRLEAGVDRTTLVVPVDALDALRSSFVCTVVDAESGSPIRGVAADLQRRGKSSQTMRLSGPLGQIQVGGLVCGAWMLFLRSEGRSTVIRYLELEPGLETDLGTIALEASVRIRGRFVDDTGRVLGPVKTRLMCDEISALPMPSADPKGSDQWTWSTRFQGHDDGSFEGGGFERTTYLLECPYRPVPFRGGEWRVRPTLVDCSRGSVDDVVVPVERVYRVAIHAEGDDAKDFGYSIVDGRGERRGRGDLAVESGQWLPPGDYRLLVGPDTEHLREIPFTVESAPVELKVEP